MSKKSDAQRKQAKEQTRDAKTMQRGAKTMQTVNASRQTKKREDVNQAAFRVMRESTES